MASGEGKAAMQKAEGSYAEGRRQLCRRQKAEDSYAEGRRQKTAMQKAEGSYAEDTRQKDELYFPLVLPAPVH